MQLEGLGFDQYRFLHLLRSGGMGEVYLAEDTQLHRHVAIKVIWTDVSYYPDAHTAREAAYLFLREAQAVAQLDHVHILPVYDSGERTINSIAFMYMIMPFREYGSFADWLHESDSEHILLPQEVEHIVKQAASALQHAHNHQIIHQDVKPSNFLLYADEEYPERVEQLHLQLADFGVAKFITTTKDNVAIRGTPTYMAPEQWNGRPVPATDQYALAIMAYELLVGHPPFIANTTQQLWHQHFHMRPRPPSTINPNLPKALDGVFLRALAKNPAHRFRSISAFAHAFRQALRINGNIAETPSDAGGEEKIASLASYATIERTVPSFPHGDSRTMAQHPPREIKAKTVFLFSLVCTLILGSSLLYYFMQMKQSDDVQKNIAASAAIVKASSTALAVANATNTAQTNATATVQTAGAQATATAQAGYANATATAQAQANATATTQSANATATARAVSAIDATATAYATAVTSGTLALDDSMQNNNQGYNWDTTSIPGGGGCAFTGNAYHSTMPQLNGFSPCFAQIPTFMNFSYEVQMTIIKGNQGGIAFRANSSKGAFYYFHINTSGVFQLDVYNSNLLSTTLSQGSSPAINTNLNKPNLITVIARGGNLELYINKQHVASVTDTTYTQGEIGVVAENVGNPADVAFSNMKVWTF